MIARVTPSPGSNPNLLQQILGNVGRYNTPPAQSGLPGGGAPSSGNY